jgi:hypothetical protein
MHMMKCPMRWGLGDNQEKRGEIRVSNLGVKFWDVTNLPYLKESRPRDSDWA